MSKAKAATIEVQGTAITVVAKDHGDYISLTDMVRNFEGGALIEQRLKNKDTVLFLGVWERINNQDFNSLEFEGIRNEAGRNSFSLFRERRRSEVSHASNLKGLRACFAIFSTLPMVAAGEKAGFTEEAARFVHALGDGERNSDGRISVAAP